MIYNISDRQEEILQTIDTIVGKPLSVFKKVFSTNSKSSKMTIMEVSPNFQSLIDKEFHFVTGYIEMRPNGIIVHIYRDEKQLAWPIAFDRLILETSKHLKIQSPNNYIVFSRGYEKNRSFVDQLKKHINNSSGSRRIAATF